MQKAREFLREISLGLITAIVVTIILSSSNAAFSILFEKYSIDWYKYFYLQIIFILLLSCVNCYSIIRYKALLYNIIFSILVLLIYILFEFPAGNPILNFSITTNFFIHNVFIFHLGSVLMSILLKPWFKFDG